MHKITAGSGYSYITRHVARMDATEGTRPSLASYYSEKGEVPGRWIGSGMRGLAAHAHGVRPLKAGDEVTTDHMQALFGAGYHPQAIARQQALLEAGLDDNVTWANASRLGIPFRVYNDDVTEFRVEVARRFSAVNRQRGRPDTAPIPLDIRAQIRSDIAHEFFVREHGRAPLDERERAGNMARLSRQRTTAVAGFDLTFSPVKSVSTLWALAPTPIAAAIERAHDVAVADALRFVESEVLYTRLGDGGIRQVDTRGLIAAAFTHRDSRAGDPDLHTHVAIANKVQDAQQGRWLAIDGRVLYKAMVAISETYNTALEKHLTKSLGVQFAERPNPDPRKRPIREIVGVTPELNQHWSARRQAIETRRAQLAAAFRTQHGRPPTPTESIALAQQANLETRQAKHAPRSLTEQRTTWHAEALGVLGSQHALDSMLDAALHPTDTRPPIVVDDAWLDHTARLVIDTVEARRSTWQYWHVHAEASRRVRSAHLDPGQVTRTIHRIVDRAITEHSISLRRPSSIEEPEALRRRDGTSVYTVAGSTLYTSSRILDAEARVLAHANRSDGHRIDPNHVSVALLETAANGITLNTAQADLVTAMATSGRRLQVAIAPAGSGKTTAMNALARAWTSAGGTILGLAPSAAAAAHLRDQIDTHTDTLAKLTWGLTHGDLPAWAHTINEQTLVVIDEAGMADTLTLDTALTYLIDKGASVRLIGDDQQLAAIGAGGILRDIQATHGALQLNELVRFADPAEGNASLALRDGRPEGLGFYLDHQRIHVGDLPTLTDEAFTAWHTDTTAGLDSIMLAPTRDLAAQLNQRARDHRLQGQRPDLEVPLANGSHASVGDTIITRANNRCLRVSATDWVKNGDRWTITAIDRRNGHVHARHTRYGRTAILPASYVATSVELGYASTIHTAQGISVDTMHGLITGTESRQQLYTMLTRGKHANHAYLEAVSDGNEHSLLLPETLNPPTPSDLMEAILARDGAPQSATTLLRAADDLHTQLGEAACTYYDAINAACEDVRTELELYTLERRANQIIPGITLAEAWPALRGQLLYITANQRDPYLALEAALTEPLNEVRDPAAVLAWRLDTQATPAGRRGPLPWLPGIPDTLNEHPTWGPYLHQRHELVRRLADHLHHDTLTSPDRPTWLADHVGDPTPTTIADVAVWRAATNTEPDDTRPLGAPQHARALTLHQRRLQQRLATDQHPAIAEWRPFITTSAPVTSRDDFLPVLAQRLAQLTVAGIDAPALLRSAVAEGELPDDHAAGALWWRINRHLSPALNANLSSVHRLPSDWVDALAEAIGSEATSELQASPWWPALANCIERGYQRGWPLHELLAEHRPTEPGFLDACQAMTWRIATITDPLPPTTEPEPDEHPAPNDLHVGYTPVDTSQLDPRQLDTEDWPPDAATQHESDDPQLSLEYLALVRRAILATPPELTDADVERMHQRADAWRDCPATRERLVEINEMAATFYERLYPTSWARPYLRGRFGDVDDKLAEFRPGFAPDSWTALTNHLRGRGVTDDELLAAGLVSTARTGKIIDRFRDLVVFPIVHNQEILGFVGRRNPEADSDKRIPKYINTPDTPLFHKGDQLFLRPGGLPDGATPVIVEGPMDAIAISILDTPLLVGVAPLGTALTDAQVRQLAEHRVDPTVATDNDLAGREAAKRAYWLLTLHGLSPLSAVIPEGQDPAALLTSDGDRLRCAVTQKIALAQDLIQHGIRDVRASPDTRELVRVIAAADPAIWEAATATLSDMTGFPRNAIRTELARAVVEWNEGPSQFTRRAMELSNARPNRRVGIDLSYDLAGDDGAPKAGRAQRVHQSLDELVVKWIPTDTSTSKVGFSRPEVS